MQQSGSDTDTGRGKKGRKMHILGLYEFKDGNTAGERNESRRAGVLRLCESDESGHAGPDAECRLFSV